MTSGQLIAFIIWGWIFHMTWKISKKRKIGLTKASFLALLFTPIITCIVSLCTKIIDATKEEPTYKQRLSYENTTALCISIILYFIFALWTLLVGFYTIGYSSKLAWSFFGFSFLYLINGIILHDEREQLMEAKQDLTNNSSQKVPTDLPNTTYSFMPLFIFDSNKQERIEVDNNNLTRIAYYHRRVVVEHNNDGQYRVSVIDVENDKLVLRPVIMHKLTYSGIDECDSMVSDDDHGEYKLNVYYKNGQVDKCVICRKSNNMMFHYCKE